MSETHFCGALILAITFLLIIRYSLRKKNSFLNIREISILLGLLFATLGAIASGNEKKKKGYPAYGTVFNETINTILYLSCLSITDLVVLFMGLALVPLYGALQRNCIAILHFIGSVTVYSLTFSIFLNCLIVIKRIARLLTIG